MRTSGMHLNRWSSYFNPENDIPFAIPVLVWLPHLPLHCRNNETLKCTRNTLQRYIDRAYPKEWMFSCERICVEAYLEKGLLEAILLILDNSEHKQPLDYEKIPFKIKSCCEYCHFANNCKKVTLLTPHYRKKRINGNCKKKVDL
jgi:hypothetical protein